MYPDIYNEPRKSGCNRHMLYAARKPLPSRETVAGPTADQPGHQLPDPGGQQPSPVRRSHSRHTRPAGDLDEPSIPTRTARTGTDRHVPAPQVGATTWARPTDRVARQPRLRQPISRSGRGPGHRPYAPTEPNLVSVQGRSTYPPPPCRRCAAEVSAGHRCISVQSVRFWAAVRPCAGRHRWPAVVAASALMRAAMAGSLRNWCRQRLRNGPMLPTGTPSVALICA